MKKIKKAPIVAVALSRLLADVNAGLIVLPRFLANLPLTKSFVERIL